MQSLLSCSLSVSVYACCHPCNVSSFSETLFKGDTRPALTLYKRFSRFWSPLSETISFAFSPTRSFIHAPAGLKSSVPTSPLHQPPLSATHSPSLHLYSILRDAHLSLIVHSCPLLI
ncbi:hypothetical protein AMECASPLE_001128 [Ameca splendens]|uniref:Secreted protein n=1 Tax=Ameca splendens TaxID=208324 RepID=A0ABV0Y9N0_9TELE